MTVHGDAAIFCTETAMRRMLETLCGEPPPRIVVADGDDPALTAEALRHCREHALPLILFSRSPTAVTLPPDVPGRILARPFLFADFTAALRSLTDSVPRQEPDPPVEKPLLLWDAVRRAVICGSYEILLTPREADVFAALYAAAPAPVSREKLQKDFTRSAGNGADVYISYLRKKLAALPLSVRIHSERGSGYALFIQPAESGNTDQSSGEKT